MRQFAFCVALVLGGVAAAPGPAAAQSMDRFSRSLAAAKPALDVAAPNYAAIVAARAAVDESDDCRRRFPTTTIADFSVNELKQIRFCIAEVITRLLDRMIELKSMQRAASFDYAVFSETARLLTVTDTPSEEAVAPFAAMLRAAQAAASTPSERALTAELTPVGAAIEAALGA